MKNNFKDITKDSGNIPLTGQPWDYRTS